MTEHMYRERLARTFTLIFPEVDTLDSTTWSLDLMPGWDSVAHINLIISVEQEFKVTFTPEEATAFGSFEELLALVSGKVRQ